jgi:Bifunctional DNA primase/polymerase, N-terminal
VNAPSTVEQALAYARHGWPVFPCQPGSKEPATRHGFHDATTDPDQITWWWDRHPVANLAIATGAPGPDVLDVDQHGQAGNGFPALSKLIRAGLTTKANAIVATPGGGLHAYFTGSNQHCGKLPRHHLDFRAHGGYVLAPPSQVNGKPYRLIRHRAEAGGLDWAKVVGLLEPGRHAAIQPGVADGGDLSHLATWVAGLSPDSHNRNDGLFWAACRAAEAGDDAVLAELAIAARATGLAGREIQATIRSARRTTGRRSPEHHAGREVTS